jgi:DNA-binding transcriptional ArsR family regulator
MMAVRAETLVRWLRAAGEPSRLRLLALCAANGLSVSDLAQTLGQSEPRVSRHLKILCEAGLIERLPQGQWVHYRIASEGAATGFVRGILAQADARDPQLQHDRSVARAASTSAAADESRLGRAMAAFVGAGSQPGVRGSALLLGAGHPELLESAARTFGHLTAVASSRRAAQAIQARAARAGFECRVVRTAGPARDALVNFADSGNSFDAVILDHPPASGDALAHLLDEVARVVAPAGRVWIFEPYESLEVSRERVVEHPLARLRRLLGTAGLSCERLSPIEADGQHVLAALARASSIQTVPQSKGVAS